MSFNNIIKQINKDVVRSEIYLHSELENKTELINLIDYLEFDGDLVNPKINFEALFHIMGEPIILQDDWLHECVFEGNAIDEDYWITWNAVEECEQVMITLDLAKSLIEEANNSETLYLSAMLNIFEQAVVASKDFMSAVQTISADAKLA